MVYGVGSNRVEFDSLSQGLLRGPEFTCIGANVAEGTLYALRAVCGFRSARCVFPR